MQEAVLELVRRCAADQWFRDNGIEMLITCTARPNREQAELYAIGRTRPGRIVTRAKPGMSWHNAVDEHGHAASEACDFVPLRHGKAVWGTQGDGIDDDPGDDETDDLEVWGRFGAHAEAIELNWYGRPDAPFREFPHVENPHPAMARILA